MHRRSVLLAVAVLAAGLLVASLAGAAGVKKNLKSDKLTGYQENADVSSTGTGSFKATIDDDAQTITYELELLRARGWGRALRAHPLWQACGERGRVGVPVRRRRQARCPATEGTVTGVIDAADVVGPAVQGIEPGSFAELTAAMRAGHTYVNVHTPRWMGGEIRAQINDRDANN